MVKEVLQAIIDNLFLILFVALVATPILIHHHKEFNP
jgi:hypothetical protein